jgi:GDP-4-dehydro-6-deoxy-D-mannose reductase
MTVFITGMTGFIGSHLAELLLKKKEEVHGTIWDPLEVENIAHIKGELNIIRCDVRDKVKVEQIIHELQPREIYHLAAQSYPTISWKDPLYTLETNVIGTANIFEAVKKYELDTKIFVACSSAEYGFIAEDAVPVREDHALNPLHPYGVSKVAVDLLAYQYFVNFGIKSVRGRIFNTTGPRKVNDVCADFTQQIAQIAKSDHAESKIYVGNLTPRRDITDVRDMVNAIWLALQKGKSGEVYNLCSARAYKISEILDHVLQLTDKDVEVVQLPAKLRPTDEPIIMGDNTKFCSCTGWKPQINIKRTLQDMVEYWRAKH